MPLLVQQRDSCDGENGLKLLVRSEQNHIYGTNMSEYMSRLG